MKVDVSISKDPLKGDDRFELHMKLNEYESEEYPFKDDWARKQERSFERTVVY